MHFSLGSDHAGFKYKELIKGHLMALGHSVEDCGPFNEDSVDYADFGHPVAKNVESKHSDLGIVVCGSGNGINMTVNKHQSIRSALCWTKEIAELERLHNDANIIAVPARFVSEELALEMITIFLETAFEGGRHANRVNKIRCS